MLRVLRCATVQYAGPGAPISTAVCVLVPYWPLAKTAPKSSKLVLEGKNKKLEDKLDMEPGRQLARQLYVSRSRRPVLVPVMYVRQEFASGDRIIIIRVDGPIAVVDDIDDVVGRGAAQQ